MVISRTSADAPRTFPGQVVGFTQIAGFPTGQDTEFQLSKIVIHTPEASTPKMYAETKITFIRDGVGQAGLQAYTRP